MKQIFEEYTALLEREMVLALGCTEPIAIAYAAAVGRKVLGFFPERMVVACSADVIKNTKSVLVPNAGNPIWVGKSYRCNGVCTGFLFTETDGVNPERIVRRSGCFAIRAGIL